MPHGNLSDLLWSCYTGVLYIDYMRIFLDSESSFRAIFYHYFLFVVVAVFCLGFFLPKTPV